MNSATANECVGCSLSLSLKSQVSVREPVSECSEHGSPVAGYNECEFTGKCGVGCDNKQLTAQARKWVLECLRVGSRYIE